MPEDSFLECGDITPIPMMPDATDECSSVSITSFDVTIPTDCGYVIERTFVATDACNNSSEYIDTDHVHR